MNARTGGTRLIWILVATQLLIVLTYGYAAIAYLTTDAKYFSEESPPGWSWPAVIVVGIGFVPAMLCLALALPALAAPRVRSERRRWTGLAITSAAAVLMLVIMATPPGWALFDWYVS